MPMLDVFNDDTFNMVSLTAAINKLPYVPGLLGSLGLFESRGITTTTALIEERHGVLGLVPKAARGTMPTTENRPDRAARAFPVPHLPMNEAVLAEDVQNVRAFGQESTLETVAQLVNDRLANMRANYEATWEFQRSGAIQGITYDADGTTVIYNFFDEFGITENAVNWQLSVDTTDTKTLATEAIVLIEDALGATPFTGVAGFCDLNFWNALVSHPTVENAYDRWMNGQFLRENQLYTGFEYAGITWYRYRGKVGNIDYIPADTCRLVPTGVSQLFQQANAPGTFIETVNTIGQPIYVKQERMPFDVGIELHGQSNPLFICTRPQALVNISLT